MFVLLVIEKVRRKSSKMMIKEKTVSNFGESDGF